MQKKRIQENTRSRGEELEQIARHLLVAAGWQIVAHNFRTRRGEIDIIAAKDDILAFFEVKSANRYTQNDLNHVISKKKRQTILETSKLFLNLNREYNRYRIRYDVMVIQGNGCMRHIEGAFFEYDEAE